EDGIRAFHVTGVQTCALPISADGEVIKADGLNKHKLNYTVMLVLPGILIGLLAAGFLGAVFGFKSIMYLWAFFLQALSLASPIRSEERRVGDACRCRCARSVQ